MEKNMLLQQQDYMDKNTNQNLEEAFRYQEMELQKERENSNALRMQIMKLSEQGNKLKEKTDANKKKLKKFNDLTI